MNNNSNNESATETEKKHEKYFFAKRITQVKIKYLTFHMISIDLKKSNRKWNPQLHFLIKITVLLCRTIKGHVIRTIQNIRFPIKETPLKTGFVANS